MIAIYVTDHGEVRLSPREADMLKKAEVVRAAGAHAIGTTVGFRILALEAEIIAACNRFAKFKAGIK